MTKKNAARNAFFTSVISLLLCVSMLVGTTFAWFTDEVVSSNNVIKSGNLDIEFLWGETADAVNKNAEEGAIFNYDLWEPGYTEVKYVKIANVGNLALRYRLSINPNHQVGEGEVNLADVIEVRMIPTETAKTMKTRAEMLAVEPVGTLSSLIGDVDGAAHGILLPAEGVGSSDHAELTAEDAAIAAEGAIEYCIVLHMQEEAGNEYKSCSVGDGFSVQLLATQYTWENDSFDHTYDENAEYDEAPRADVLNTGAKWIRVADAGNWNDETLDKDMYLTTSFQFKPTETLAEAQASEYALYHADYVVYADKDIAGNTIALAGFYKAFADYLQRDVWVAMESDETITAGTEIRLVELLDTTVNYEDICEWGNDGTGFLCGINAAVDTDNKALAAGTTITVELRLYEVPAQGECSNGGGCKHPGTECELGEDDYITIGTYTYTIPAEIVAPAIP